MAEIATHTGTNGFCFLEFMGMTGVERLVSNTYLCIQDSRVDDGNPIQHRHLTHKAARSLLSQSRLYKGI